MKKIIKWDENKNQLLQLQRGFSFEQVLQAIEQDKLLAKLKHPNTTKYPNQEIYLVRLNNYVCYVPFVETDTSIFLKTIIPSRKLNKEYSGK